MVDTFHPPPSVIASWPKPNYINPVTRGDSLIWVVAIFDVVAILIVGARVYSRAFLTKALGIDDVFIVVGLLFALVLGALIIVGHQVYQSGRHIWDIEPSTFEGHRLNVWACEWIYLTSSTFIKISVLLFYRRLSVSFSRGFYIAVLCGIAYNALSWLTFTIYLLAICSPLEAYWKSYDFVWASTHHFRCGSESISLPTAAGMSAFGDFYSTVLPLLLVEKTARSRRQRIALYSLFALGFLSMGAGIARTIILDRIVNHDYDFTWLLTSAWTTSIVEIFLAIIAASAPALRPFFQHCFANTTSKFSTNRDHQDTVPISSASIPSSKRQNARVSNGECESIPDLEKGPEVRDDSKAFGVSTKGKWVDSSNSDEEELESYEMQHTRLSSSTSDRGHIVRGDDNSLVRLSLGLDAYRRERDESPGWNLRNVR